MAPNPAPPATKELEESKETAPPNSSNAARPSNFASRLFGRRSKATEKEESDGSASKADDDIEAAEAKSSRWRLGILNDKETDEVPGSVLLMSSVAKRNEPLGLRNQPARISASSLPLHNYPEQPISPETPRSLRHRSKSPKSPRREASKKRTVDGQIILEPQPDDSLNDPLNWPAWRRDAALISLGLYCMIGGGMTPILAAGFDDVASAYHVTIPKVALTTGLYMMGLGLGSVVASPTAILYGKRPVYLVGCVLFILSSVWCALSPSYTSLVVARIVQGVAVSPVECLPSATIAEIFFLHERAYRIGIYTLLLLSGKNLVPLASAAVIERLGWRWVFWVVSMVVGFFFVLLFFFVPETFWDRTPRPHKHKAKDHTSNARPWPLRLVSSEKVPKHTESRVDNKDGTNDLPCLKLGTGCADSRAGKTLAERRLNRPTHVNFASLDQPPKEESDGPKPDVLPSGLVPLNAGPSPLPSNARHDLSQRVQPSGNDSFTMPDLHNLNSPYYLDIEGKSDADYFKAAPPSSKPPTASTKPSSPIHATPTSLFHYTSHMRLSPPKTFTQTLRPYHGRLSPDSWLRVAIRPFILFCYPAVLWSTVVYSLSIGWLIVLSESAAHIYRSRSTYNFDALQTGLVYISPFIGGILGTAVAGKLSDVLVRFMARHNDGVYEPEFRLLMAIPVALATAIGLMGFGWSAEVKDGWIVPTVFFGIISFGCSLGSTTAITFCVDSYRQYAGEALVTLNFSKNIFHGLVFSLFFNRWLDAQGPKRVFLALGGIQLACLAATVPMYIYGKRARMWTVRRQLMERS